MISGERRRTLMSWVAGIMQGKTCRDSAPSLCGQTARGPGGDEWPNAITHLRDADRPGPSRDKTFQSGLEWSSRQDPDVWHIKSALTKQTNKQTIVLLSGCIRVSFENRNSLTH